MTVEERNHLIVGVIAGAAIFYLFSNKKAKASPTTQIAGHADTTTSDYGNPVVVAQNGQLNTIVGMRSPIQLTYHDFNILLQNPNDVLKCFSEQDVIMEQPRAMQFLNEIGWLSRFEEYENELPTLKIEDPILFALNLGAGFRLLPPMHNICPQ